MEQNSTFFEQLIFSEQTLTAIEKQIMLTALVLSTMEDKHTAFKKLLRSGKKVYCVGNGGSYDNALFWQEQLRAKGIDAVTVASEHFFTTPFEEIFTSAELEESIVLGISGSGNSENVLAAAAQASASLALTGRDGGKLKSLVNHAIVVPHQTMELIEDIHTLIAPILISGEDPVEIAALYKAQMENCVEEIQVFWNQLVHQLQHRGTFWVVGPYSTRHLRADMQRGFTNTIPLKGFYAPEMYSVNSGLATANDDGAEYLYIDSIDAANKTKKTLRKDTGIIFWDKSQTTILQNTKQYFQDHWCKTVEFGSAEVQPFPMFEEFGLDKVGATMIGHLIGPIFREQLAKIFEVRPIPIPVPMGKKLPEEQAKAFERQLRKERIITKYEVAVFSYGKVFAAKNPEIFGLERGFY